MSIHRVVRCAWLLLSMAALPLEAPAASRESSPEAARLAVFTQADGVSAYALSLKPQLSAETGPRHVVVLFDTSASQVGEYRDAALGTLRAMLSGLGAEDRVRLVACDLEARPMHDGFVAPASAEMGEALRQLEARVPLGSGDMENALRVGIEKFPARGTRAVVYIGQGRSPANLITADEFAALSQRLREARVPVTSYAIGPRQDLQLLGSLAVQSGGQLLGERRCRHPEETRRRDRGRGRSAAGGRGPRHRVLAHGGRMAADVRRTLPGSNATAAQRPRDGRDRHVQDAGSVYGESPGGGRRRSGRDGV
jgi:hypothetical protein